MSFFDDLFEVLPQISTHHSPQSAMWRLLKNQSGQEVAQQFRSSDPVPTAFGPFGEIVLPFFKMGAINSTHLFGMDELILFAFYQANKDRYRRTVDFGANIGLHSIIMSRVGFDVRSFEPDEHHIAKFKENAGLNDVKPNLHPAAISLEAGKAEFVRVLGNTTGSHIKGAKSDPYGDLETFEVVLEAAAPHLEWADLAKIDIEGHEAELITGLPPTTWEKTDAILEVGTQENAVRIFDHLIDTSVKMFTQKTGWRQASAVNDMPYSHRDGSLFLTYKDAMPW